MSKRAAFMLSVFFTLIPYLVSAAEVDDIQLFEIVSRGDMLDADQQKRAGEIYEAWQLSESRPSDREHPRLGNILKQMAGIGAVELESDQRAAADVAILARVQMREAADASAGSAGSAGGAGAGWGGLWVRDLGAVIVLAAGIVIGGLLVGYARTRVGAGRRG